MSPTTALLTIGEFARLTHLSVKALRHYDEVGLLHPVDVDASSGYRHYATAQVPTAHVIRRFRELDMPLEQIRTVLEAEDKHVRDQVIIDHLQHMEDTLERTQSTVASLRALLEGSAPSLPIELRSVASTLAVAVRDNVAWGQAERWLSSALNRLHTNLSDVPGARAGPDSALFDSPFFEDHFGEVLAFVPVDRPVSPSAGIELLELPAARHAVTVHRGPFRDLDQAYGALGTFVTEQGIAAPGPIREHYVVVAHEPGQPAELETEVCWPIRTEAVR